MERRERRHLFHLVKHVLLLLVAVADNDGPIGRPAVDDAVRDEADALLALGAEHLLPAHVLEDLGEDVLVARLALELALL